MKNIYKESEMRWNNTRPFWFIQIVVFFVLIRSATRTCFMNVLLLFAWVWSKIHLSSCFVKLTKWLWALSAFAALSLFAITVGINICAFLRVNSFPFFATMYSLRNLISRHVPKTDLWLHFFNFIRQVYVCLDQIGHFSAQQFDTCY
jgi:hypothetical protein